MLLFSILCVCSKACAALNCSDYAKRDEFDTWYPSTCSVNSSSAECTSWATIDSNRKMENVFTVPFINNQANFTTLPCLETLALPLPETPAWCDNPVIFGVELYESLIIVYNNNSVYNIPEGNISIKFAFVIGRASNTLQSIRNLVLKDRGYGFNIDIHKTQAFIFDIEPEFRNQCNITYINNALNTGSQNLQTVICAHAPDSVFRKALGIICDDDDDDDAYVWPIWRSILITVCSLLLFISLLALAYYISHRVEIHVIRMQGARSQTSISESKSGKTAESFK